MLITANNDPSQRLQAGDIELLAECERVHAYPECGYYCVIGHKDGRRVVHAHAHSRDEVAAEAAERGYRWTERGPVRFTPAEARESRRNRWGKGSYAA